MERASSQGSTLIELVVGLSVLAVLAGFALPSLARFLAEQELQSEARRLADAVMLARSEAVKRNAHVVICATTPLAPCGSASHWHEGWLVFVDTDGDAEPGPGDEVIGREGSASAGVTEVGNRPVEQYFRFDWLGRARLVSGALQMGTIDVCRTGLRGYQVVLANSGRIRIDRATGVCP